MARYRKKPVEIEAVQFNGLEVVDDVRTPMFDLSFDPPEWICEATAKRLGEVGSIDVLDFNPPALRIHTLEGYHTASEGDFIIRGIKGELYPCKPDIFAATYERVE